MTSIPDAKNPRAGTLQRLRRDRAGNTIAMLAISLIPLAGLVGGAVDMSRMYLTKTRLQQACDAGALAGRKVMGGGTWGQSSYAPRSAAEQFFDGNFKNGDYGTSELTRAYTESAGKVSGTASAKVPMTLMKIFKHATETISVTCDAEMRLPNTDVMFVLDTTGSMASKARSSDTDTKIVGLRKAVRCFYEVVARLDTEATCGSGPGPNGGTGSQVQIRFGFMPYATNVNVGRLLPTAWMADRWQYQSREPQTTTETYYTYETPGQVTQTGSDGRDNQDTDSWERYDRHYNVTSTWCRDNQPANTAHVPEESESGPFDESTTESNGVRTVTWKTRQRHEYVEYRRTHNNNNRCTYDMRDVEYDMIRTYSRADEGVENTRVVFNQWRYAPVMLNVSGLKNGTGWNDDLVLPIGNGGSDRTIAWDGCIEERATVKQASYSPIPADAEDLDIDNVPVAGDQRTLWGPALPDVIYPRRVTSNWNQMNRAESLTATNYYNNVPYYCPTEARRLQQWPTAADFDDYVDRLVPDGNTYHDIGMIWGARFMSPTGIFRSDNEFTPQGGEIERHMIFMSDGDTVASNTDYGPYGLPWFDRRTTDDGDAPSNSQLVDQVNARFEALCTAVKNKNITLWVVSFGDGNNATTRNRLQNCATPGRFFQADGSDDLIATFRSIADQISQLRLTK